VRKGLFIVISVLFFINSSSAQSSECNHSINGVVKDAASGEPIPFANVILSETTKGTTTDDNGHFEIHNICKEEFDIVVSFVGYKTSIHHHDSYHQNPTILLAPDNQMLESVVVEGDYNPTSLNTLQVKELNSIDFAANQSGTLGDLASGITGVSTISTGQNIVKPIIHGLHSNRVLIINNGVRHEFQNWGVEHAPEIDPSLAQSLEVVKGAATVRYGPEALGGVILINSPKMNLYSGLKGEIATTFNTNGRSGDVAFNLRKGWHKWVVFGQGSVTRQGDLHAPTYQLTNTGKQERSFAGGFRYHHDGWDFEGYFSHFYQNLGILRGSVNGNLTDLKVALNRGEPAYTTGFSYTINHPGQQVSHNLAKLKGTYSLRNQKWVIQYAYQSNHRQEFSVRRREYYNNPTINLILNTHSLDVDWHHPDWKGFSGVAGIQMMYQDNQNQPGTQIVPFVPNYNSSRIGAYAIESRQVGKNTYEFGIRYDFQAISAIGYDSYNNLFRNNLSFNQFTGSLGLKRMLGPGKSFQSNIGLGWRPPNISELYGFGKHGISIEYGLWRYGVNAIGDIKLKVGDQSTKTVNPEVGWKWINTYSLVNSKHRLEMVGYVNLIRNFIYTRAAGVTYMVGGYFPYFIYNQTNALLAGMDVSYEHSLMKNLVLKGAGSYLYAKDIRNDDVFIEMPPARVSAGFEFTKKPTFLDQSQLAVSAEYVFQYFQAPRVLSIDSLQSAEINFNDKNFDFMAAPKGYFLPKITWSARRKNWSWTAQVTNLFNTQYRIYTNRLRYFANEPGRNFRISLKYTFN